jgi:Fic family protein
MRIPLRPPDFATLLAALGQASGAGLIEKMLGVGPSQNGRYRHWDKLKRLTPPAGLSTEEWWLAIKLARRSSRLSIPLRDEHGRPFSFIGHDIVAQKLHRIDRRSGHVKTFEPQLRSPATRSRYILSNLAEEAITSSQLEGASTTRLVAKEMIRTGRKPVDASERMILRNYDAMRHILAQKETPLRPEMVLELARLLEPEARVRTEADDVRVVEVATQETLHVPPPASTITKGLEALCQFANEDPALEDVFIHPVLRSITIHFWIGFLHPFTDGNGRTARALFYWSMLRRGYWLWEYVSISTILRKAPSKYARSFLYTETDDGDLTYFVLYHADVMLRALDSLEDYMARKSRDLQELTGLLRHGVDLNHRQLALLTQAIKDPDTVFSFRSHMNSHGVVYQTARADILGLVDADLIEQFKKKNRLFFRPSADLEKKVRAKWRRPAR